MQTGHAMSPMSQHPVVQCQSACLCPHRIAGTLVAFDKYFNMVLRDVEEAYTVLLAVERPAAKAKPPTVERPLPRPSRQQKPLPSQDSRSACRNQAQGITSPGTAADGRRIRGRRAKPAARCRITRWGSTGG